MQTSKCVHLAPISSKYFRILFWKITLFWYTILEDYLILVYYSGRLPYFGILFWKITLFSYTILEDYLIFVYYSGRLPRLFAVSSLLRELSPKCTLKWPESNRVQITCNISSDYHVQQVVCYLVRRNSSAVKFDRVEFAFYFSLILMAEPL